MVVKEQIAVSVRRKVIGANFKLEVANTHGILVYVAMYRVTSTK